MGFEWSLHSLGDVLSFANGRPSPTRTDEGKYFVYGSNGPIGRSDLKNSPENTIIIGRVGSYCGSTFFSEIECWVTDNAIRANAKGESDARFAYYLLRTLDLNSRRAGSGQPLLNQSILSSIEVAVPSLEEQRAIAKTLGAIDDRIDNLHRANTTLESIAQALFKSWFVDFDPVRAKAEGREPEGMDAATAALFPDSLVDSELGAIPEGWQIEQIGDLVDCLGGGTPSTKNEAFWDGGEHHWATPKDLSGLQAPVLSSTARKITGAGVARISSGLLPAGTLLMSSRAPIGYLAIAAVPTAINQGFIAIPPGRALPPAYLLFWAKANMDLIKQKANGSTFMEISRRAFRPIKVLLPPPEILAAFMSTASPILNRIKENERHGAVLAETRDTLLPRLISGKLHLHAAEREIEAATA